MIRPQRYFAWRVAREIFLTQVAIVAALLIVVGFSLRIFVYEHFTQMREAADSLAIFDRHLTSSLSTMFVIAALAIGIAAVRTAQPLGRLIQRARELRRLDSPDEDADHPIADLGEWSDLERALNRIHKDLRGQTDALTREREELSTLIGAVSDAIFAIDRFERPLFFNAQFATHFRNDPKASLSAVFRLPEVLEGYRTVLKNGERQLITASLHTANHQLPRHFSVSLAPLRRHGEGSVSEIDGAIGIFHDVTELKQSEQIRIEFVGNASHELRTPLTSIKGYVDTLRGDLEAHRLEDAGHFVNVISRNVDRLIFLVNDLLDLSTLESGAELTKSPISTGEITETALRQIENKRATKRQQIHVRLDIDTVQAEPQRLEQVLVNLVHNAIKYIPESSRIDVIWQKAEGAGAVLRVRDNGPGIPYEHQARLFERFYRVDAGRSREQGGTGLGLSIVKHIMLKHGGSIQLKSKPGAGSEFICYFP